MKFCLGKRRSQNLRNDAFPEEFHSELLAYFFHLIENRIENKKSFFGFHREIRCLDDLISLKLFQLITAELIFRSRT